MQYKLLNFAPTFLECTVPLSSTSASRPTLRVRALIPRSLLSTTRTMSSQNISALRMRRGDMTRCRLRPQTLPDREFPTSFRRSHRPSFSSASSVHPCPFLPEFTRYPRFLRCLPHASFGRVLCSTAPPLPFSLDPLASPSTCLLAPPLLYHHPHRRTPPQVPQLLAHLTQGFRVHPFL